MSSADPIPKPADSVTTARSESAERDETPTEAFARLLDEAERHRLRSLPFEDLRQLARLYRGESARLARLRDRGGDLDRIAMLNALCVRGHGFLYSARPRERDGRPLLRRFALAMSGSGPALTLAWALMAVGALVGFCLVTLDPSALYALMPAGLGYDVGQIDALFRSEAARDLFFQRETTPAVQNTIFGSYLFANNTRVGILAFATGILFGIPTALLQLYNGIMIGTISAIFLRGDHAILYLAWILPHGVPELTAITLCCSAGFVLGRAVAAPGRQSRRQALREASPRALALFLAGVPLFFLAAWIESFVRESALGSPARFSIAAVGVAVLLLIGLALRRARGPDSVSVDWLAELMDETPRRALPDQPAP